MSATGSIDDVLMLYIQHAKVGTSTSRHGRRIGSKPWQPLQPPRGHEPSISASRKSDARSSVELDRAAEAAGKDRTQFVLDAATREATTVLLDQRYFQLDTDAFAKFNAALDASPAENPRLRELLSRKAPWER